MELICTTCDGLGVEAREMTHPAMNVYGWTPRSARYGDQWYTRKCQRCDGSGFVLSGTSVPATSVPDGGKNGRADPSGH